MPDNYITLSDEKGTINISEEVVAVMVAAAVAEVDGVASLAGQDISNVAAKKNVSKSAKVSFGENSVSVDLVIVVRYGSSVTDVAVKVQESVANAIGSMTGIAAPTVNVRVNGIAFDKADKA